MHPQREDYWGNVNPVGPRGVYDEAKRFAEAMTMAYHRFHGIETRIVRIFNTYGERMRLNDGRVVPAFISQALRNEPLTVFGDGSQTRSFCYVSDLVEGIYRLLMSDEAQPTNIGNPRRDDRPAVRARRSSGSPARSAPIEFRPLPEDDPKIRRPDITKARHAPRLGAAGAARRRADADDRVLPHGRDVDVECGDDEPPLSIAAASSCRSAWAGARRSRQWKAAA